MRLGEGGLTMLDNEIGPALKTKPKLAAIGRALFML